MAVAATMQEAHRREPVSLLHALSIFNMTGAGVNPDQGTTRATKTEAVARRSYQLRTGLRTCTGGFYASKHAHALSTG